MTFAYFWVALISAFLMVPPAKAQAPLDEFGFLEQWQILSEDFLLGKVTLNEKGMPDGYDTEAEKITEEGHFQVSVSPEAAPSPFNEIHTWLIKIESPDREPVSGADIKVYGGMPLHNHAFATAPAIIGEIDDGVYALEGVKFHMFGWWTLALGIDADGKADRVSFNLILEP